jgi:putative PEP-CTERM system TPR-repeat lipoprotein
MLNSANFAVPKGKDMPGSVNKRAITAVVSGALLLAGITGCNRTQSTEALVAEAQQYQQKGDNKAALIQLKNALSKSPDDAEVRLLLGSLYIETGDVLSADKEIRKALSLGMNPARAMPALAKTMLAQGQVQKMLDETEAESAKRAPELMVLRGEAYLALGQPAKAKEAFDAALGAKADDADALIGLARHALTQKDIAAALRLSEQAVAKNPKNPAVWLFKADLLRLQAKTDEALAAYDQVLALKPAHRSAHLEKAYLEIQAKKFDAAKADIDAAKLATPNSLLVLYTQALLDFNQEKHTAARDGLQKILRAAPEHLPTILLAGAVEFNLGSMQQAEQHLKKYLEKNPGSLYARKLLVSTLLKEGRPTDAVAVLGPALKDGQQDPQLLALAGQAHLQAREFNKAAEYFEKASALAPQEAKLHTALALSKLGQGDDARAVSELELSTKLNAKLSQAGVVLTMTELRLKRFDKALAAVKALEAEQPNDPMVQNLKGGVQLAKNDPAGARASFEKALVLQPTYFPAVANLAQMAMQDKKPELAKKQFEALLEKDKKNLDAMTALAALANSQGHPEEATVWLEKANSEHPDAVGPGLQLASHYLRTGQKQKGLTLARKLSTPNPANPDLLDLLAQAQLANGDQAGALENYSKLVNVIPKSPMAHSRLASVHMLMKNDTAAAEDVKRALSLQADYLPAQLAQVELAVRANNTEQALAVARQIQKQRPKAPIGYGLEGDLLLGQKKTAQALLSYEKAFGLTPTPALMIKLHGAMTRAGNEAQAEARMAQWQKEHPADMLSAMYLAEARLAKKQFKVAIPQLQAILKQDPKHVVALNNLAWAYQQEKDPRAIAAAELAYQVAGEQPAVMDTLGWLLVEQGDTARGLPLLRKAVTLAPQAWDTRYHLAAALFKSGDKANARKELEQALASGNSFNDIEAARALLKQL